MTYYNENDAYPVRWLRSLMDSGHLPDGTVDERSIADVTPKDLEGYRECHFFAGIGGWPYALRLADWPDLPIWTGSCPCQPFSSAGKRGGHKDERHLWPEWFRLIRECRPPVIFGEQVASKDGLEWLDAVSADLEGEGYALGAADLCAAGVGAPHIRQRLYFVAFSDGWGREGAHLSERQSRHDEAAAVESGRTPGMADAECRTAERHRQQVAGTSSSNQGSEKERERLRDDARHGGEPEPVGDADESRLSRHGRYVSEHGSIGRQSPERLDRSSGFWSEVEWIPCLDGKARPIEPGSIPLAHGIPARVGRLRAYGNAIVPQVAAEFVRAFMETQEAP